MGGQNQSATRAWTPKGRITALEQLRQANETWDLVVIGGGITGAGVYAEAASRGLKVLLVEQQDFAWGTSSRSSKMVHGGLRYLGTGQFKLANDSVKERQRLMQELPGLVEPLPFMMGHYKGKFPGPWIFGILLTLYDWMAGKRYHQYIRRAVESFWIPGIRKTGLLGASQFADAVTDDARLVMRVLQQGNSSGGLSLNYIKAENIAQSPGQAQEVTLRDMVSNDTLSIRARAVVNATGAWTDQLREKLGAEAVIRPLRGSHLVFPGWRLPVAFSVSFFHPRDKRPVFVFPWEGTAVVGTTDLDHASDLSREASIAEEEVSYLLEAANAQFPSAHLRPEDVVSTWSGVRPVVSHAEFKRSKKGKARKTSDSKPSAEKREHAIWDDRGVVSVAGGKLTTYRLIALDVLQHLRCYLPELESKRSLEDSCHFSLPFEGGLSAALPISSQKRLQGRYGEAAGEIDASTGRIVWTDTFWSELSWCCAHESVQHLDDLLLRRTRIGLLLPEGGRQFESRIRALCCEALGWTDAVWQEEWQRYLDIVSRAYGMPGRDVSAKSGDAS